MSASQRRSSPPVISRFLAAPQQFGFFQAMRVLEHWLEDEGGLHKVSLRNSLEMRFPVSEIESVTVRSAPEGMGASGVDGSSPSMTAAQLESLELTPTFMGLLGVTGALPAHYTEALAHRELYQKDTAARSFLDMFSHRALMLFYAAWRKNRLPLAFERDGKRHFMPHVLSVAGLGSRSLHDRLGARQGGVADATLAYFAGTLQQRHLSARQLQSVLQDYLGVSVRLDQFQGRWYQVPKQARLHLGLGVQGRLGQSAMLGERVWQRDLRVRVALGPLTHDQFCRFLPGGAGARALQEWLTLVHGVSLEYEVALTLSRLDVRGASLSSARSVQQGRLGWDTFVLSRPTDQDRSDVRYDIHAAA